MGSKEIALPPPSCSFEHASWKTRASQLGSFCCVVWICQIICVAGRDGVH